MRTKEVTFNGKKYTVKESRIKDLEKMMSELSGDFDTLVALKKGADLTQTLSALLVTKIRMILPKVKEEEIPDAFPSEVEEVIEAFIEVNFSGLRKLLSQLFSFAHIASR